MNILLFSHFAGSAKHGMVFRNYVMAKEWVEQGHRVTIVAGSFAHSRQQQPIAKKRLTEEWIDGIRYIWVKTPPYNADSAIGRVLALFLFTVQCQYLPLKLDSHYDWVIASSPHPFSIYPAYKYARQFRARLIYDIRDLWPLSVMLLGNMSARHPFIRLLQQAEDFACKQADLVISVPQNASDYLQSRGLPAERFLPIGNGVSAGQQMAPLSKEYLARLGTIRQKAAHLVTYIGALGTANALATLVEAMALTPSPVHLVIMGDGPEKQQLQYLAESLSLQERIHFFAPVGRDQIATFLADFADIGIVSLKKTPLFQYGASPTKVNDYMLAKIPMVYAVGDTDNAVERSGAGVSCEPGNAQAMAQAITGLVARDKAELARLGEQGYDWCMKNQLVSQQLERIEQVLGQLQDRQASIG